MSKMVNIRCLTRRKANDLIDQVNKAEAELEAAVKIAKAEHELADEARQNADEISELWRSAMRRSDKAMEVLRLRNVYTIAMAVTAIGVSVIVMIISMNT